MIKTTPISSFISHNLYDTTSEKPELSAIYTLNEFKDNTGKPIAIKSEFDFLFNYIIDDVANNPFKDNLVIGRQIIADAPFLATDNYNLVNNIFSNIDDKIDYEKLMTTNITSAEDVITVISDVVLNVVSEKLKNLCITREMLPHISTYIERLANKIFRNLNQLIRVKRDWRLYGPGATLIGNYLQNTGAVSSTTTVPDTCFTRFKDGYIAGHHPYGDETPLGSIVDYSYDNISPINTFTPAEHTHSITFNVDRNLTKVECDEGLWSPSVNASNEEYYKTKLVKYNTVRNLDNWKPYNNPPGPSGRATDQKRAIAIATDGTKTAKFSCTPTFSYNKGKKYLKTTGSKPNSYHLELPVYFTYVWQWKYDDPTQLF